MKGERKPTKTLLAVPPLSSSLLYLCTQDSTIFFETFRKLGPISSTCNYKIQSIYIRFFKDAYCFCGDELMYSCSRLAQNKESQTDPYMISVRSRRLHSRTCPPPPCANAGNYTEPSGPSLDSLSVVSATSPAQLKEQRGVLKVNAVLLTEPAAHGAVTNR